MTMANSRRAHTKSRRGCQGCKKGRVKCDETLPRCVRCTKKGVRCEYEAPSTLPKQLQVYELRLMHHYTISTFRSVATTNRGQLYAVDVPRLCFRFEYALHALLSLSASHLAYLEKDDKRHRLAASNQRLLAMSGLRKAIAHGVTKGNSDAVLMTAIFLAVQQFTVHYDATRATQEWSGISEGWFPLFQGLAEIVQTMWNWLDESIFSDIRKFNIDTLEYDAESVANLLQLCEEDKVYIDSIIRLGKLYNFSSTLTADTDVLPYITAWPIMLSQEFVELLKKNDPRALIIIAHYFRLLDTLKTTCWYLDGFYESENNAIVKILPQPWRSVLEQSWAMNGL